MTSTTIQADKLVNGDSLTLHGYDSDAALAGRYDSSSSSDRDDQPASPLHGRHVTKETIGNVDVELWQDLSGGCGGKTWEAAYVMINYMLWKQQLDQSHSFLDNKTILDLGSGTGLVGIAVAKACPTLAHMELTDQIPMLSLMQDNIKLNHLESKVSSSILNWGEPHDHKVDIVFASDCVYLEVAFQPLVDTLVTLTNNNKDVQIYMSYRKRRKADKRFFMLLKKQFHVIDILDDPERSVYSRHGLHLYRLERKTLTGTIKTTTTPSFPS